MSKPLQEGRKYLQLTNNILLEYIYIKDRYFTGDIDNDVIGSGADNDNDIIEWGTYGKSDLNKYLCSTNGYTNEVYFMNDIASHEYTHNSVKNTVFPVKKDSSQWVKTSKVNGHYYSKYDSKWSTISDTDEHNIQVTPNHTEYIPYDIVRIYFQSGYHTEYDGFIFNVYTKNRENKYTNLLSVLHENYDDVKSVSEPMWFADKIYTTYIEYRIPSTNYLSTSCFRDESVSKDINCWTDDGEYDAKNPPAETLPKFITGVGFYNNPAVGIDVHGIIGYTQKHDYRIYNTRTLVSTLFPNKDSYEKLFANVRNSSNGDFYEIYGFYESDPQQPVYDTHSLYEYLSRFDSTFTLVHIISVSENWMKDGVLQSTTQAPMTFIQNWEALTEGHTNLVSPVIKFRPVLEHAANMVGSSCGATINYTLRIVNNRDNISIIKTSSCSILNPRRFGLNYHSATFNGVNDVRIYNKIEQSPQLNIMEVVTPIGVKNATIHVNRYITSSFIDRRNIRVSVVPVKIENIE